MASSRRRRLVLLAVLAGLVVLVVGGGVAYVTLGRQKPHARSVEDVVEDFRSGTGATAGAAETGQPTFGVYPGEGTGDESVGVATMDEKLGPSAPMTVAPGEEGCSTARLDLNTNHWRSWTFCSQDDGSLALAAVASSTKRHLPGYDFSSLNAYDCDVPLVLVWSGQQPGDRRTGHCVGTSDSIEGTTDDVAAVEVLELTARSVAGEAVPAVRLRTSDTFSGAQTGTETNDLWLAVATGIPLAMSFDTRVDSDSPFGTLTYRDTGTFELTSLTPAT